MLHRQSGMNSLPVKQFSNDIAVLLPWAGHGFNCSFSAKDQFVILHMLQLMLEVAHLNQVDVIDAGVEASLQHGTESLQANKLK